MPWASTCRSTPLLVRSFAVRFSLCGLPRLLRPLLTPRSASQRRAFTHKARSPHVRTHSFAARPPDLLRLTFDHESFAVSCPLALVGTAFYPVLVHPPAASLHASSSRSVALSQLRFASFGVTNSREDLHLQECAHAGRTRKRPGRIRASFSRRLRDAFLSAFAQAARLAFVAACVARTAVDDMAWKFASATSAACLLAF